MASGLDASARQMAPLAQSVIGELLLAPGRNRDA